MSTHFNLSIITNSSTVDIYWLKGPPWSTTPPAELINSLLPRVCCSRALVHGQTPVKGCVGLDRRWGTSCILLSYILHGTDNMYLPSFWKLCDSGTDTYHSLSIHLLYWASYSIPFCLPYSLRPRPFEHFPQADGQNSAESFQQTYDLGWLGCNLHVSRKTHVTLVKFSL